MRDASDGERAASRAAPDAPAPETLEKDAATLATLREACRSLVLATIGGEGEPHAGYTPHLIDETSGDFLIFVSRLSAHTRDLLADPRVSVMLIADEGESAQIFARSRVSYGCTAEAVPREDPSYESLLDAFAERHGKTVALLRQLPDFVLFRLRPRVGQLVTGFGRAYRLAGERLDRLEHTRTG